MSEQMFSPEEVKITSHRAEKGPEGSSEFAPVPPKDDVLINFSSMSEGDKSEAMKDLLSNRKFIVLDIGPGFSPPFLSVDQKRNDIWFGVDKNILEEDPNLKAKKGRCQVEPGSKRVLIPNEIEDVPSFKADLIMMIAPNPQDIEENSLLEDLDRFCKIGTKIFILMDTITEENRMYGREARQKIKVKLKALGFEEEDIDIGDRDITPQSQNSVGGVAYRYEKFR